MMQDLSEAVNQVEKELVNLKTSQMTQSDSANYYSVSYMPGWYISDYNHWREHTIKCIPYSNEKNAIFMADMRFSNAWGIQGTTGNGRNISYAQNIITWHQDGETSAHLSDEAYAAGVPKGFTIFSNVEFYIETSYIDKSI